MKKKTDFNTKTPLELMALLKEKREELRAHRFASVGARTKDTSIAKSVRADIARIMTALSAKKTA
jgi:ribosomal protein L29